MTDESGAAAFGAGFEAKLVVRSVTAVSCTSAWDADLRAVLAKAELQREPSPVEAKLAVPLCGSRDGRCSLWCQL